MTELVNLFATGFARSLRWVTPLTMHFPSPTKSRRTPNHPMRLSAHGVWVGRWTESEVLQMAPIRIPGIRDLK
jgi:hypothetical protein